MISTEEYKYCQRNLLEEPEKYFFSECKEQGFKKSYDKVRRDYIKFLKTKIKDPQIEFQFIISKYGNELYVCDDVKIISENMLGNILYVLVNSEKYQVDAVKNMLDKFLKKYEVVKKIFSEYDVNMIKLTEDYKNIRNYILLSLSCLFYYKYSANLKYLNTAIKINDMLCSNGINIEGEGYYLLYIALIEEEKYIKCLFDREGI